MATLKFYIRNKTTRQKTSIYYRVNFSTDKKIRGTTNIKIQPKYWDGQNGRIRNRSEISDIKDNINNKLLKFKNFVFQKINSYDTTNIEEIILLLKEDILIYFGKKEEKTKLTFYQFIDKFINQSKGRILNSNKKPISSRTIKEYERTIELIKDFETKHNYPISFDSINLEFYHNFIIYLEDKDYSLNTIGKFIKQLKVFMNEATEQGLNNNLIFRSKKFIKPSAKSFQIYLNKKELEQIIQLDLSEDKNLNNARDLFIIGAYTGLRVSDFNNLSKQNIKTHKGQKILNVHIKKTNSNISIPIHYIVENIIKKYDGAFPKKMADQHINTALKKIGKKAKINDLITYTKIKGGKEIKETKPKYEMITNHTARRSFCTNAYIDEMPTLDIMAISGHTSEKTFLNYIKITQEERAIKIANSAFFKPKDNLKIV